MSGIKSALSFVGKSVAFSLIAGLIWSVIFVVDANIGARSQSNSPGSVHNAAVTEQIESYNKQMDAAHAQLVRSEELQSHTAKMLDTEERLNAEQERLLKRFSAVLDKWEKMPAK
jgi:hypothetical protein